MLRNHRRRVGIVMLNSDQGQALGCRVTLRPAGREVIRVQVAGEGHGFGLHQLLEVLDLLLDVA